MVRRSSSPRRTLSSSAAHSTSSSRDSGNSRPFGVPSTAWPERPTRCRKRRDRARRAELADQIDIADVDAEFERGGGDQRLAARRASAAARRRGAVPWRGCRDAPRPAPRRAARESARVDALGHAARVDEDQRRAMLLRSARPAGRRSAPTPRPTSPLRAAKPAARARDRARGDGRYRRWRSRARPKCSRHEKLRDILDRLLRRREADALQRRRTAPPAARATSARCAPRLLGASA